MIKPTLFSILFYSFALFFSVATFAERYKRPMTIHKIERMGLEVWTELEPKWNTELMMNGRKPIFVAHTPHNTYPMSGMTWVNHKEVIISDETYEEIAKSLFKKAAKNYQITVTDFNNSNFTVASYGQLKGYEFNFEGKLGTSLVDVKIFTGRALNKGPITMQAYTSQGKMNQISEQIRRSWGNTKYLPDN